MGKKDLRKLKSNLKKIDQLYADVELLSKEIKKSKKEIKKHPNPDIDVANVLRNMKSTEQIIITMKSEIKKIEKNLDRRNAIPYIIVLFGFLSLILSFYIYQGDSNYGGLEDLLFYCGCLLILTVPVTIVILDMLNTHVFKVKAKIRLDLESNENKIKHLDRELMTVKSAISALDRLPHLNEEMEKLEEEIAELYEEIRYLIPYSDLLKS